MPAFDHDGNLYKSEKQSAADVMRELDEAADALAARAAMSHAKAVTKILEARPGLYAQYKQAKRADFSS